MFHVLLLFYVETVSECWKCFRLHNFEGKIYFFTCFFFRRHQTSRHQSHSLTLKPLRVLWVHLKLDLRVHLLIHHHPLRLRTHGLLHQSQRRLPLSQPDQFKVLIFITINYSRHTHFVLSILFNLFYLISLNTGEAFSSWNHSESSITRTHICSVNKFWNKLNIQEKKISRHIRACESLLILQYIIIVTSHDETV